MQQMVPLTAHAFVNIFFGSKRDSLVWLLVAVIGFTFSTIIIFRLACTYLQYDVVTEVSWNVTARNNFPSITFCDVDMMLGHYFAYCGVSTGHKHEKVNVICDHVPKHRSNHTKKSNSTLKWSNGIFDVRKCHTWDGKNCLSDEYFRSVTRLNDSCFTWNWAGHLFDMYGHAYIEFTVNHTGKKDRTFLFGEVHDPDIHEIGMANSFRFEPAKVFELRIRKTMIKRLPSPYPSRCVTNMPHHIFPGRYTRRTCIDSIQYIAMLKTCGDVLDYHKLHIPEDILKKYKQNRTIEEAVRCMIQFSSTELQDVPIEKCPVACDEMDLYVTTSSYDSNKLKLSPKQTYAVDIQYQDIDHYKVIQENPKYIPEQLIGEIGGVVALFIGASFVTLMEFLLHLTKRFGFT